MRVRPTLTETPDPGVTYAHNGSIFHADQVLEAGFGSAQSQPSRTMAPGTQILTTVGRWRTSRRLPRVLQRRHEGLIAEAALARAHPEACSFAVRSMAAARSKGCGAAHGRQGTLSAVERSPRCCIACPLRRSPTTGSRRRKPPPASPTTSTFRVRSQLASAEPARAVRAVAGKGAAREVWQSMHSSVRPQDSAAERRVSVGRRRQTQ